MMWKTVEYTKKQINTAGNKIASGHAQGQELQECLQIIDNWRAAHAFPMNTFAINLKHQIEGIKGAIVVQRLKRLETIIGKIQRFPEMQLYRMQDLGGCRAILPNVNAVYTVKEKLQNSRIRHELHNEKDYIASPKNETGYRGIHLIYKYRSDKRNDYNGLLVEIQLRTKLQHLWATAVETVGIFTQNGLKFNQGSERWLRFFKVVSAIFSIQEGTNVVEGISTDAKVVVAELIAIMKELEVINKLYTIGLATSYIPRTTKSQTPGYYLLALDVNDALLRVNRFNGIEKATEEYNKLELQNGTKKLDIVLVSAQSFDALTHAYPNYFADIKEFTNVLNRLIKKYNK